MFQNKTYSQIVSGFEKVITECEQLILKNVKEDKSLTQEIERHEAYKLECAQKRMDLELENRKAGSLISKIRDLIED